VHGTAAAAVVDLLATQSGIRRRFTLALDECRFVDEAAQCLDLLAGSGDVRQAAEHVQKLALSPDRTKGLNVDVISNLETP
jgi:hypothetical protein